MVDAREFLDYIASHLVENGGYVGSAEIRFERLEEWLKEMENKQTGNKANEKHKNHIQCC